MNHREYNYLQHYCEKLAQRNRVKELNLSGPQLIEIYSRILPILKDYLTNKPNRSIEETAFMKMLDHPGLESIKEILHALDIESFSNISSIDQLVIKMKELYVNEQEKKAKDEFSTFLGRMGKRIFKRQ